MKTNYTKGEWTIEDSIIQENKHIKIKSDKVNTIVCNKMALAFCGTNGNKEALANAKLIAAAPNLLEELSKVFEILDNVQELNMNNYNEDQVRELNDALIEAYLVIKNGNSIKKATE